METQNPCNPPIILALDTTTAAGSHALYVNGNVVDARIGDAAGSHGQRLPGELQDLLESHGLRWKDIDLYAVATGPGSFTGLRVGIATIQGLALVHHRQVVGVSALDAWAHGALDSLRGQSFDSDPFGYAQGKQGKQGEQGTPEGTVVGVALEAQRGEVFAALYETAHKVEGSPDLVLRGEPFVTKREQLFTTDWNPLLRAGPLFVMSDVPASDWIIEPVAHLRFLAPVTNLASHVASLAAERARKGQSAAPHAVQPLYVRRPDVELARERRVVTAASEPSNHE